jgi:membrane-associated phospholipid phosphatase
MAFEGAPLLLFGLVREIVRAASIILNDPFSAVAISVLLVLATSYYFREQRKLPFLAGAVVIALLLGFGFKSFLAEGRPCETAPSKVPCPTDFSLPSMHALLAFTIAIIAIGTRSFPIFMVYASFIAFSRVYLGVHTIAEVAAGLALAFLSCVLAELFFRRMRWHVPHVVHIQHDIGGLAHSQSRMKIEA